MQKSFVFDLFSQSEKTISKDSSSSGPSFEIRVDTHVDAANAQGFGEEKVCELNTFLSSLIFFVIQKIWVWDF